MSEESIAIALNHERERVTELVPQYIRPTTDNLILFLKEYYDYLNSDSQSVSTRLKRLVVENNIDETSAKYLDAIQNEIARSVPNSDYMDRTTLYKRIVHFYRSKGTKESVYTFFRIFFNDVTDLEIIYGDTPWTYKIRSTQFTTEWKDRYKKLVHPAGLKFSAALLFDAIVRGGSTEGGDNPDNDPTDIKAGWDPDYWNKRIETYDYTDSQTAGVGWYRDLVPPYAREEDSQYTAFLLSKYSPLVNPRIKRAFFGKGSKRHQPGGWDNQYSYNRADTFYDSQYDSQLGIPPYVDSQSADVKFILSANIFDGRDTFARQRLQGEIKFFDPSEIASFGNYTFSSLSEDYLKQSNQDQLSNIGVSVATIPFTLNTSADTINEGETVDFTLSSSGDFLNQALIYSKEGTLPTDEYSVGSSSFIARPFIFNNTWTVGDTTKYFTVDDESTFKDVYKATENTNYAGIPITVRELNSPAPISDVTLYQPWGFGMYNNGSITGLFLMSGGQSFSPVTATELSDSQNLPHWEILFGTEYDSQISYISGDQFVSANNLYQVTGGTHLVSPSHPGGYPNFGTTYGDSQYFAGLDLKYKGAAARAFISATGDPRKGDIANIQFKTDNGTILNGQGYYPIYPSGSSKQYDRSRFRRVENADYSTIGSAYHDTSWQQGIQDPRPWAAGINPTAAVDTPLQWESYGVQKTSKSIENSIYAGGSSTIRFTVPIDSQLGEADATIKIRLSDYNTIVKQITVEDGYSSTLVANYASPASEGNQSAVDFTISFDPYSDDMSTTIPWAIEFSGSADSQDLNGSLSGNLTRSDDSTDSIELDIASDYYTEGDEDFKIVLGKAWNQTDTYNAGDFIYYGNNLYISVSPDGTVASGSDNPTHSSGTETVNGIKLARLANSKYTISISDVYFTPSVTFNAIDVESSGVITMSIDQGSTNKSFSLNTSNIPDGTIIPYVMEKDTYGGSGSDIITAPAITTSGNFTITGNSSDESATFTYADPGSQLGDDSQEVTIKLGTLWQIDQLYVSGDFIRNSDGAAGELYVVGNDGTSSDYAPTGTGTTIIGGIRYTYVGLSSKTITVVNQD